MQMFFEELAAAYKKMYGFTEEFDLEYLSLIDWLRRCIPNTYTLHEGRNYNWHSGLPSGVRYTSDMNDILNYCYTTVVKMNIDQVFAGLGDCLDFEVCGDDSYHVYRNKSSAIFFSEVMSTCGFVAQPSKQQVSNCGYEYLRVQYSKGHLALGCLCRTVASFVSGNWESDVDVDPLSFTNSVVSVLNLLFRRGADKGRLEAFLTSSLRQYYFRAIHSTMDNDQILNLDQTDRRLCTNFVETIQILRRVPASKGGFSKLIAGEVFWWCGQELQYCTRIMKMLRSLTKPDSSSTFKTEDTSKAKVVSSYGSKLIDFANGLSGQTIKQIR
jgi:hypothetical protein